MVTRKKTVKKTVKKQEMDKVIVEALKKIAKYGEDRFKAVKTGENLDKIKQKYGIVYAEKYLEETEYSNKCMWDLIRITKYGGLVAVVVKIGKDKASDFRGSGYFGSRFLPKFGFNVKLLEQKGDTIYFIGQV